jgi:hypothetical protein
MKRVTSVRATRNKQLAPETVFSECNLSANVHKAKTGTFLHNFVLDQHANGNKVH